MADRGDGPRRRRRREESAGLPPPLFDPAPSAPNADTDRVRPQPSQGQPWPSFDAEGRPHDSSFGRPQPSRRAQRESRQSPDGNVDWDSTNGLPPESPGQFPISPDPDAGPLDHAAADASGQRRGRLGLIPPVLLLLGLGWLATAVIPVEHPAVLASIAALLAMLMPLVTVIAVPVLGLTLIRRRWFWAAFATVIAVGPWLLVLDHLTPYGKVPGESQAARILVVNAHDGEAEADRIVDQVRSLNTDVLIVTELSGILAHDLTVSGIDATLTPVSVLTTFPVQAGIGVYSRFPVSGVEQLEGTHWPTIRATVEAPKGTFTLIATHTVAPTPSEVGVWAADLAAIQEASNVPGSVIVAGTLNATAWNPQFRELTSGRLYDAAAQYGRGLRPTWPSWLPLPTTALDHVLVTGNVGVSSVNTARVPGSDHRSLSVTAVMPQS